MKIAIALVWVLLSALMPSLALAATASANFTVTIGALTQTIASITPTAATVNTAPCVDGTVVTALTATMTNGNVPPFAGTWSVTEPGGTTHFRISGANLLCNGSVAAGSYTPTVTATPTNTAIAAKPQAITVTIQTGVAGTCGVGQFSNSSCPPLPSGTSQWTYIGGSEFNVVPGYDGGDPQWTAGTAADGQPSSGIGCTVNHGHVSVSGGILTLTGATRSECLAANPNWTSATSTGGDCTPRGTSPGEFCVGPTLVFALQPACATGGGPCLPTSPGGIYMEWRVQTTQAPYYWAVWQDSITGVCPPNPVNGLEADTIEAFGTAGGGHFFYGNYSTCLQNGVPEYNNPTDFGNTWHNAGTTYIPGDSVSYWDDGSLMHSSSSQFSGVPTDVGAVINFLWARDSNGGVGITQFDWLRIYRAQ